MEVIVLGPGFAAEIRGIGLADVAARDDAYAAVRAAFAGKDRAAPCVRS